MNNGIGNIIIPESSYSKLMEAEKSFVTNMNFAIANFLLTLTTALKYLSKTF